MRAIAMTLLTGCIAGAAPIVGYGADAGLFAGGEVNVGLPLAQLAAGYQQGTGYLRVDGTINLFATCASNDSSPFGGRIGGGIGLGDGVHGMFNVGAGAALALTSHDNAKASAAIFFEINLRYLREWQILFIPRLELRTTELGNQTLCDRT